MAVVGFDSDVLIGFLNRDDAHHSDAVARVRAALAPGTRRLLCAVNYAEILIGPVRAGAQERVKQMLTQFNIEIVQVDTALAERATAVRARTNLKLPDAFPLATAIDLEHRGHQDVDLASFDENVLKAHRRRNQQQQL
jgi:predicted nucleic acid-binding protein